MTLTRTYRVRCDFIRADGRRCDAHWRELIEFEVGDSRNAATTSRRGAHHAGWVRASLNGATRVDLCPEHAHGMDTLDTVTGST